MKYPEASIVLPVYNEERHIRPCLQSILDAQPFAERYEVLVVDGGSTDRTREVVREFASVRPWIRLLDNPQRYAPQAFNIGIRASLGDFIFILGGHSSYDASYFRLCLETAHRTGADNTGGRVVWEATDDNFMGRVTQAIGYSRFAFGSSPYRRREVPSGPATSAAFGCYRRSVFEKWGLYDERLTLNQDWELNQRIIKGGGLIWLDADIQVHYYARQEVDAILKRAWDVGRWVAYMWRIAPHTVTPRHAIPALFTTAVLLPGLGMATLGLHQTAAIVAAGIEAARFHDPRLLAVLPPFFAALHGAYGGGTLAGIADLVTGHSPVAISRPIEYLPPRP